MKARVVIVGGGFGGVTCAETLSKALKGDSDTEIVLFNDENHLVFSPLLAEVVGSSINALDVIVPLRQLLPRVYCRTETVQSIDLKNGQVHYESDDGHASCMSYDHVVVACGNVTNLNVVPGMADHAFPLKTVGDASALRSHIMEQLERAEVCEDAERRRWLLTFLIVGGGFSGVEAGGEINDLVRSSAKYFRNFGGVDMTVTLIHSRDQILPEMSPNLREFARRKMERAGVRMVLSARVGSVTPEGVGLQGGEFIKGGTIVCTIGSSTAPVIEKMDALKDKGRLLTDPDMRLRGATNAWAVGDCALIVNSIDGQMSPTTGQFAEREGRQCARNILRALKSEPTRPFRFKKLGELCSLGGHAGVAMLFGVHLVGFVAWFVWRGVYLFKLPTWARRFQVGFDWAWLLLFPRDLAHVRTDKTDRVTAAHFQPGDMIIERGDPATHFFVIKEGEVEVTRATPKDPNGEVLAVLGPGSFFGEKALLSNEPRVANVRARTAVDVLMMGKNVFTRMSSALAPLRDALAQALNRRAVDVWRGEPQVYELLKRTCLRDLMEPVPQPVLKTDMTLREISRAFVDHANEFFYLSSDGETLEGIITITDIVRARSMGANDRTPARDFMTKNPVALAADDDCALASTAIREYRLKSLPVVERKDNRKLVGCLRLRRVMAYVFHELGNETRFLGAKPPETEKEPEPMKA
jgi:NADH dehydrogenase